jgi:predicted secreted hydrolase
MRHLAPILALALAGCAMHDLRDIPPTARVDFAADQGPHERAQTEWWHVHADLVEPGTGEPLELFAAFVVQRTDLDTVAGLPAWLGANPAQTAFVKIQARDRKWTADRVNFPDLLAARFVGDGLDLRHNDWRIAWEGQSLVLRVGAGRQRLDLRLTPRSAPLLPGEGGLVEVPPGSRQLWAQVDDLAVEGRWRDGGRTRWVEGTGFYKHEWGRLYDPRLDGFQWFDLPIPGDRRLVIGWLLDDGMSGVPGSLAWIADAQGRRVDLPVEQLRVTSTDTWHSLRTGARWPTAWHIEGAGLDVEVRAVPRDQEIWAFPAAVYAGPATAEGSFLGQPVAGRAFVEQVGADMPKLRFLYASRAPAPSAGGERALATRDLQGPAAPTSAVSGTRWTLDPSAHTFDRPPQVAPGQTVVTLIEDQAAPPPIPLEDLGDILQDLSPETLDAILRQQRQ